MRRDARFVRLVRNWTNLVARQTRLIGFTAGYAINGGYYGVANMTFQDLAGAWHTAELAFCFDNTKRCEQGTGNTPEAQALAKKMATAWANFARTGKSSQ